MTKLMLRHAEIGHNVAIHVFGYGPNVTSHVAIRNAILEKSRKYGSLGVPYIIVVNGLGDSVGKGEFYSVLFGQDGVWQYRTRNIRISGINAVDRPEPLTGLSRRPFLFSIRTPITNTLVRWRRT